MFGDFIPEAFHFVFVTDVLSANLATWRTKKAGRNSPIMKRTCVKRGRMHTCKLSFGSDDMPHVGASLGRSHDPQAVMLH